MQTEQFNIRLPVDLVNDLDVVSKLLKINKSEWVKLRLAETGEVKSMRRQSLLLAFMLVVFSCSGFAGGDNEQLVIIQKFKFVPQEITIKRGQTLRWENREKRQYHSVWFEALGEEEPEDYLFLVQILIK